jgi:hypothetical protein
VRAKLVLVSFLAATACGPGVEAACPVDGARYVLRDKPAFTAVFRRVGGARSAHELVLDVHSKDSGRTFSFTINRGNGYGDATLAPTKGDVAGSIELYTVEEDGKFTDYFGASEGPAPRHLLMPKLGPVLWYQINALTGVSELERERMPQGFFDRVTCGPANP